MSKSLKITNGDLSIGSGRSFELVTGSDKLGQDLRLWVLEKLGTDSATPNYGTTIDGGTIQGQEVESLIGQILTEERVDSVREQINSLLLQYQQNQLARIQNDLVNFGQKTLTDDEIIQVVNSIQAVGVGDVIVCRVTLTTPSGSILKITIPVDF